MRAKEKSGFTIVELLTVIAIILLLMGALATAVTAARRQAKTRQAIAEAEELTKAIIAYENYSPPGQNLLADKADDSWKKADRQNLAFVLGEEDNPNGEGKMPVLFEGGVVGDSIRDPWGNAFRFRIKSTAVKPEDSTAGSMGKAAFAIPNINRISADEVN